MQKSAVLAALITHLETELESLLRGARASFAAATDPDSKAENKYDTRTLEASYVARGQAQRVAEVQEAKQSLLMLRDLPVGQTVKLGSLITLEIGSQHDLYFISPAEGGIEVIVEGQEIMAITPASPLGSTIMGLTLGASVKLPSGHSAKLVGLL
jgi:transcription elongation GreA/GreB family factor